MVSGSIEYLNLKELSNEEYKIIDGEADITGWPVIDESGASVGKVRDLLFDPEQNAVRYLIVDLDSKNLDVEDKAVLLPIGFINLGQEKKEVVIPVLHQNQISLMPQYIIGEVTRDTEVQIRSAIGSPAALRIEEEITELEHPDFYQHHHFDRGNILSKKQEFSSTEDLPDSTPSNRKDEQNTIHELVENAHNRDSLEGGDEQNILDRTEHFNITLNGTLYTVEPQENGTYRILDGEEKIGVIYAEPAEVGTVWRTMDKLDDGFVTSIGEAIASYNESRSGI